MIRIVHTSDLHLDADIFSEDKRRCELRKKERRSLFANVMMYARDQRADVLLICGDFLDKPAPEEETRALILREFENTPSTEIFIACGKSDALRRGSFLYEASFPGNVHIFPDERLSFFDVPRLNARVYGYSFRHRNVDRSPLSLSADPDPALINLFCGYVRAADGGSLITGEEIGRSGFDYLALGGNHEPGELLSAGGSRYAFSGSPEGVDFDDCGPRSVRIAAIDKTDGRLFLQSKRVGLSRRRFERIGLSVEGQSDLAAVSEELLSRIRDAGYDRDTFLEVVLTGSVPYTFRFDSKAFERARGRLAYLKITDGTEMLCSGEKGRKDDFRAVFQATVAAKVKDPELRSRVLKKGLAALEAPEGEEK